VTERTTASPTRARNISRAMQQKWQDPDYRQKHAVRFAERRQDTTKSWSRRGIPNGYKRADADEMWHKARMKAEEDVTALERRECEPWHPYVREAFVELITIMRSAVNETLRLQAARVLLEFTVGRPRGDRRVTVETAERWLDLLTA
jgi:hypothetical protein